MPTLRDAEHHKCLSLTVRSSHLPQTSTKSFSVMTGHPEHLLGKVNPEKSL